MRPAATSRPDSDPPHIQLRPIRVEEVTPLQRQAWDRLWRRLLSDGEPSSNAGATPTPAPLDKTEEGPNELAPVSAPDGDVQDVTTSASRACCTASADLGHPVRRC